MKLDFNISTYVEKIKKCGDNSYFHTFINRSSLSTGLLVLRPGQQDTQEPHDTDEVYYVISGDGYLKIKNKDYLVLPNKIFFVAKNTKHYFHSNNKELQILYFFGGSD